MHPYPSWLQGVADPVRLEVVRRLSEVDQATATELSRQCLASSPTLRRHLEAMVAAGVLYERAGESDGERPGRPPAKFSLAPAVRESIASVLCLDHNGS